MKKHTWQMKKFIACITAAAMIVGGGSATMAEVCVDGNTENEILQPIASAQNSCEDSIENPEAVEAAESTADPAEESTMEPSVELTAESAAEPAEEPAEEPLAEETAETAEDSPEETPVEPTEEPAEDPAEESTEESAEEPVQESSAVSVPVKADLKVSISVIGNPESCKTGDLVSFNITVRNNGNVPMVNVIVADDNNGLMDTIGQLLPGEFKSYISSHTVTEEDAWNGTVSDSVAAAADAVADPASTSGEVIPYGQASVSLRVFHEEPAEEEEIAEEESDASLSVEMTVVKGDFSKAGDVVEFEIRVVNNGKLAYENVLVQDELTGMHQIIARIEPGEKRVYRIRYTVTEEDAARGYVENSADATAVETHTENETAAPEPARLLVRYLAENGTELLPSFSRTYEKGARYDVACPQITGYTPEIASVGGTITEDTVIDVHYTRQAYSLTVTYRDLKGNPIFASDVRSVNAGETYTVQIPQIEGYETAAAPITGVMPGRNVEINIFYSESENTAEEQPADGESLFIEGYMTPLGLGNMSLTAGECIE